MLRAEFGGRAFHAMLPQDRRLSTAFDAVTDMAKASFQANVRVIMVDVMRTIIDKVVAEVTAVHIQAIIEQAALCELCSMFDPTEYTSVPKQGLLYAIVAGGFGTTATFTKFTENSELNGRCPASSSADTLRTSSTDQLYQLSTAVKSACVSSPRTGPASVALDDVDLSKKENCDQIVADAICLDESEATLVEEIPQPARMIVDKSLKAVTVLNEPTSNDPAPEKGPVHGTNGNANLIITAAKGKEQDDDDEDDDDDDGDDDDDYEEEEEDDNDNKVEPGDDEEDVEGEDEEGDEEAGEEDGEDDGEADDNGEGPDDDGEEEGEEEDDVEGEEDADEDADEEQEDDEDDADEDPEDEDEDDAEGESEEDIEDLEPPKKKRK